MRLVANDKVEGPDLLQYCPILFSFHAVNGSDHQGLVAPTGRKHAIKVFAEDAKVEAKMFVHFVLPLESEARGANDKNALRGLPAHQASYEKSCLDGLSKAHVIGKHVAKSV